MGASSSQIDPTVRLIAIADQPHLSDLTQQQRIQHIERELQEGADINGTAIGVHGETLLQLEIENIVWVDDEFHNNDVLHFLIQHPQTDLTHTDDVGDTALHTATAFTTLVADVNTVYQVIDEILQREPTVIHMQNHNGSTPLHHMIEDFIDHPEHVTPHLRRHMAAILHMIQQGADVTLENNRNESVRGMLDHPRVVRRFPRERQQILDAIQAAAAPAAPAAAAQQGGRKRSSRKRSSRKRMQRRSHRKHKRSSRKRSRSRSKRF